MRLDSAIIDHPIAQITCRLGIVRRSNDQAKLTTVNSMKTSHAPGLKLSLLLAQKSGQFSLPLISSYSHRTSIIWLSYVTSYSDNLIVYCQSVVALPYSSMTPAMGAALSA